MNQQKYIYKENTYELLIEIKEKGRKMNYLKYYKKRKKTLAEILKEKHEWRFLKKQNEH